MMIPRILANLFIARVSKSGNSLSNATLMVAAGGGGFMLILAAPVLVILMLMFALTGFNTGAVQAATCQNTGTEQENVKPEPEPGEAAELPQIVLPLCSGYYLTSPAGHRGQVGDLDTNPFHRGVDLAHANSIACGQPIMAIQPGTVALSDRLTLSILHLDGTVTEYLHSEQSDRLVKVGQQVSIGQVIALVGNVQPSLGCHLDIRIRTDMSTDAGIKSIAKIQAGYVDPEIYFQYFGSTLCHPDHCTRI